MKSKIPISISKKIIKVIFVPLMIFSCGYIFLVSASTGDFSKSTPKKNETSVTALIDNFFTLKATLTPHLLQLDDVKSLPDKNSVTITFTVSDLILGRVYYSTTSPIDITTAPWVSPSNYGSYADSRAVIRHLSGNTRYYYVVYVKDFYGNTAISENQSFITKI